MSNTLNIGLIGSGFMGQAHADAYRRAGNSIKSASHPGFVCDCGSERQLAEQSRRRLGFEKAYGDWRKMLEDPKVDVIDITTPNNLHAGAGVGRDRSGKERLLREADGGEGGGRAADGRSREEGGVHSMVAFNNLKTPAAMVAKQIIDRGEIGEPIRFRGRFDQGFFNDPSLPWSWRCSRELAGTARWEIWVRMRFRSPSS